MKKTLPIFIVIGLIVFMIGMFIYDSKSNTDENIKETKAVVLETDDSNIVQAGLSKIGFQLVNIKILEGEHKGKRIEAKNNLVGSFEFDNFYEPGDKIIAGLFVENGEVKDAITVELYRQNWQLVLFGLFIVLLIAYARFIGLKALLSFVASLYLIWKFLIPGLLEGKNPLVMAIFSLILLSAIIIFSVAGFTKKGFSAFIGTIVGLLVTIIFTLFFGDKLDLHGMTAPFATSLLFSGHMDLNMRSIFYAAIIIGASGAAMDIAMDVAASMEEIKIKKPDINMKELIQSGFNVGRAVIGTMTTTLLLAYSGGYLTLLMLFMTKDSSFARIINLKIVSAEVMRTLVGSIGLVLVAPITAIFAGWIYSTELKGILRKNNEQVETEA